MIRKRRLTLVRVGDGVAREVAEELADRLAAGLDVRVRVERGSFGGTADETDRAASPEHQGSDAGPPQLSSNDVVDALARHFRDEPPGWILGITADDITAEGRSCVFGEATLGGRWAVISAARFGPRGTVSPRLLQRLYREAVHEVGHLAGLEHCAGPEPCVMHVATTVSAVDSGISEFCPRCEAEFVEKAG